MKIAVLSGKGGAGKTMVAVNLAAAAGKATYVDCDVEEPNGRLFWKPEKVTRKEVMTKLPVFDKSACDGCRACVDFCRFHALAFIKGTPKVFSEVCHACGGCAMVCPKEAVSEQKCQVGFVERGFHGNTEVITGILNLGEASGVPVIRSALHMAQDRETVVIDCPPGSACSVTESISDADYCILVAEPTAFGFHNFQMVYELASLLGKPCGVVINKEDTPYEPLEVFCQEENLPVLAHIPYGEELAAGLAGGEILTETNEVMKSRFETLLKKVKGGAE